MIRFLRDGDLVELEDVAADTTVLGYLREHCQRNGTKEGCASGDCGACTVVVAELCTDEGLSYTPVNACIAPLGSLHGKQLITVENLRDGVSLHPVQQAMVESHGSQCGFCTPGFVMSLFALYHQPGDASPQREVILEALGGNLCRCTGYRPIVDAAEKALAGRGDDRFQREHSTTLARLQSIRDLDDDAGAALRRDGEAYYRPDSAEAVAGLLQNHPGARLVAGATDLMLDVTQKLQRLPVLIDLGAAPDLREIRVDDAHISLSAAVTHRESQTAVFADYPELHELIERFGSLQIRSRGTVVGNIANASPIGDWPPVLLALRASLTVQGPEGLRQIPVDDFFLAYRETALTDGEFIRSVEIPRRGDLFLRAYKISKRYEDDISSVCGVFALRMHEGIVAEARIAFGGMAEVPKRAAACEAALVGKPMDDETVAGAKSAIASDFEPISDARASAAYRKNVAANLIRRLQLELAGENETRAHPMNYEGNRHE